MRRDEQKHHQGYRQIAVLMHHACEYVTTPAASGPVQYSPQAAVDPDGLQQEIWCNFHHDPASLVIASYIVHRVSPGASHLLAHGTL